MNAKTLGIVLVIALWMPALMLVGSVAGCQAGTTGILRPIDPVVEGVISNTVAQSVHVGATIAPAPFGAAIEAAGAAVLALLAVWQGLTHTKLVQLQTKENSVQPVPKS